MSQYFYFAGVDTAPAQTQGADDGGICALQATPKRALNLEEEDPTVNPLLPSDFDLAAVYMRKLRNLSARQWSGAIIHLHQRFRFDNICLDPGGGGLYIKKELACTRQLVEGVETDCRAIATMDDIHAPLDASRVLTMFSRGDRGIALLWPDLPADDNLVDASHVAFREVLEHGRMALPAPAKEWKREQVMGWPQEKQFALTMLTEGADQLRNLTVATDADGTWQMTRHNARRFEGHGKKDLAYCMVYAYVAFLVWLKTRVFADGDGVGSGGATSRGDMC